MLQHEWRVVQQRAGADGEQGYDERGHNGLHLHQRYVADDHLHHVLGRLHVAEVRLRGQPAGQAHVQVALQAEQRRHQDEQLANRVEDFPVLPRVEGGELKDVLGTHDDSERGDAISRATQDMQSNTFLLEKDK